MKNHGEFSSIQNSIAMQKIFTILFFGLISIGSLTASSPDESQLLVEKTYGPHLLATTFVNPFPGNNNQYYNNWAEGVVLLSNGEKGEN